jgi:hypothetical protein
MIFLLQLYFFDKTLKISLYLEVLIIEGYQFTKAWQTLQGKAITFRSIVLRFSKIRNTPIFTTKCKEISGGLKSILLESKKVKKNKKSKNQ